ncbi:YheU family protein [Litorivivens sp.]|uniref:YheU family protein n=1 Tax=Litorivivens sp. TaxID=2020868 RepID=UPI00356857CF
MIDSSEMVEIPWQKLSPDAFQGLLEELVTRDGTDYGAEELSTGEKVENLRRLLEQKRAVIAFSPESESWSVIPKD